MSLSNILSYNDFINEKSKDLKGAYEILKNQIDLSPRKVRQIVNHYDYLAGSFGILTKYRYPLNNETLNMFIELLSDKLSEYEWSKNEYDNLMKLKTLPNFEKNK